MPSSTPTSTNSRRPAKPIIDTNSQHLDHQGTPTSHCNTALPQTPPQQPAAEPGSASTVDSHSHEHHAIEKRRDVDRKTSRDRKKRSPTHSDMSFLNWSRLELDRLRSDPKTESLRMRELLETAVRQAHIESRRAEELQRANEEAAMKFRILNENRLAAQQETAKANAELKLYHFQLDHAQKEVEKAKTTLKEIEKQRDEAEQAAARAREKARKYQQERMVAAARDEGRKLGYEAGLNQAKREKEYLAARRPRHVVEPPRTRKGEEREYYSERRPARRLNARGHSGDDNSSPDDPPSRLPTRNPPPTRQQMQAGPSFQRPSGRYEEDDYESETESEESPPPPPRAKTPSIQVWPIDIPTADQLNESFNSHENPSDAIGQGPREVWVTAGQHRNIRGTPNPPGPFKNSQATVQPPSPVPVPEPARAPVIQQIQQIPHPSGQPPPLLPPIVITAPPAPAPSKPNKSVKFWASRPSLAKTKQQATSWYRSLSRRKKNKPVIDPIPEEPSGTPTANPTTTHTNPEPHSKHSSSSDLTDYGKMYGRQIPHSQSWYREVQSAEQPSLRNERAFARRQPSDGASVSTRVSQFDLLSTPALASNTSITTRNKGKNLVREKESFLSVIKEDSASRGNTPDRSSGLGGAAGITGAMPQPYFVPPVLHQQPSYGSLGGSAQNRRYANRPSPITVPGADAPLQPAGAAYRQAGLQPYPSNPSIDINVVPPSGVAPDRGPSPPHTGRNHLSPYHVFPPAAESIHSLRMAIDPRPDSAGANRRPVHSRTVSAGADPSRQYDQGSPLQPPRPPFATWSHDPNAGASRPESVRTSASKRHLRGTPSTTFKVINTDLEANSGGTSHPRSPRRGQPELVDVVAPASGGGRAAAAVMVPSREQPSRMSRRSYSNFNPNAYVDPAYWGVTGPGSPPAALPAQPKPGMEVDPADMERAASRLSRRASVNSGLSYA